MAALAELFQPGVRVSVDGPHGIVDFEHLPDGKPCWSFTRDDDSGVAEACAWADAVKAVIWPLITDANAVRRVA